jgi:pimeloyl-ACP methyl ester carboxylesterase
MRLAWRVKGSVLLLTALTLVAFLARGALAQEDKKDKDKDKAEPSKKVKFTSFDGVELSGTFYPKIPGGKDKDACVLLLHGLDRVKGGSSHQDGWDHLAEELQKEGYAVLSFDFRGFGDSKEVSREKFWNRSKAPQNMTLSVAGRAPDSIEFKEFRSGYYPMLANDVAAARACLDRKNDNREVNSSNLILIGAGEGATLGSLWLATECKRKRSRGVANDGRLDFDDPECRDVVCAVWLSISPSLAGISVPVSRWLVEAGADNHIPMGFLYGADDRESKEVSKRYLEHITSAPSARKNKIEFTAAAEVPNTKLRGSQLLAKSLNTEDLIKNYLDRVLERRGTREARSRDPIKTTYYWTMRAGLPILAKSDQEEVLRGLPLNQMGVYGQ